ncbi:MAG: metal-dependent hydrolase [bacterium]|nr:metal-dependent hydrolase [Acidimicrobiia bacterium]MCY4650492.1 metal-dependent hydrolase [bacterium]
MILWHLATALFGFRWVFRDPEADLRWLVAGALAPDVIDLPIGALLWVGTFASGELFAHSLTSTVVVGVAVLLLTRRGSPARRNLMVMMVGWLIHLLSDGIWLEPRVFWWPLWGWSFPSEELPFWQGAWARAGSEPWRWVSEAVGLGYLVAVLRKADPGSPGKLRRFLRAGRLH